MPRAAAPARRTEADRRIIEELASVNHQLYRAHLWCDQLRASLHNRDLEAVRGELEAPADAATGLGHPRSRRMAGTLREHRERIIATIATGISNTRLEAMSSTVDLPRHRARGFRRVEHLMALIHLVCGRVEIALPA